MKKLTNFLRSLLFDNPIFLEGIVIAPIVVVGVRIKSALLLSLCLLIITLPTLLISIYLYKNIKNIFKIPLTFITAAFFYLIASVVVLKLNTTAFEDFGIYLPIFMVNSIILSNAVSASAGRTPLSVTRRTLVGIVSFFVIAFIVSFIRELFGYGVIAENIKVFPRKMSGILYPFSGYFIIAFLGAFANYLILKIKGRRKTK